MLDCIQLRTLMGWIWWWGGWLSNGSSLRCLDDIERPCSGSWRPNMMGGGKPLATGDRDSQLTVAPNNDDHNAVANRRTARMSKIRCCPSNLFNSVTRCRVGGHRNYAQSFSCISDLETPRCFVVLRDKYPLLSSTSFCYNSLRLGDVSLFVVVVDVRSYNSVTASA